MKSDPEVNLFNNTCQDLIDLKLMSRFILID